MTNIRKIELRFPNLTEFEQKENSFLFKLLSQLDNVKIEGDTVVAGNTDLNPTVLFRKSQINNPEISFIIQNQDDQFWKTGDLLVGFNLPDNKEGLIARKNIEHRQLSDNVGNYVQLRIGNENYYTLTIEQLFSRLDKKLKNLNHVGANFGPDILPEPDYLSMKKLIAKRCNIYRYPTGEE